MKVALNTAATCTSRLRGAANSVLGLQEKESLRGRRFQGLIFFCCLLVLGTDGFEDLRVDQGGGVAEFAALG
ncbi:hypothetical protein, partial [Rhodococcus rhodochrous]|uniref:hypothetical protein n=1 Tax=Rhodococcus rhodochrous TaxID=1829 RepID=UPI001EE6C1D7